MVLCNNRKFRQVLNPVSWVGTYVSINFIQLNVLPTSVQHLSEFSPLYSPCFLWNSPDQNTGVDGRSLLQGIFPIQGSSPHLHCRRILYQLSHQGSPSGYCLRQVGDSLGWDSKNGNWEKFMDSGNILEYKQVGSIKRKRMMSRMTSKFLAWTTGLVEVPLDKMKKAKGRTDNRIWEPNAEFTFGHDKLEIAMKFKCVWHASEYQSFVSCHHYEFLFVFWISDIYNYNLLRLPWWLRR